jgi:phosphoenolpyruvate synthase/pyruvate phosphate dikinase
MELQQIVSTHHAYRISVMIQTPATMVLSRDVNTAASAIPTATHVTTVGTGQVLAITRAEQRTAKKPALVTTELQEVAITPASR